MSKLEAAILSQGFKSIAEFVRISGLPKSTIYALTNGQNDLKKTNVSLFFEIADALGMDAKELYYFGE